MYFFYWSMTNFRSSTDTLFVLLKNLFNNSNQQIGWRSMIYYTLKTKCIVYLVQLPSSSSKPLKWNVKSWGYKTYVEEVIGKFWYWWDVIKMWSTFIYRIVLRCIQISNQTANKLSFELIKLLIPFLILLFFGKSFCV